MEELFLDMVAKEPLLRMAVSRGLVLSLDELGGEGEGREGEGGRQTEETDEATAVPTQAPTSGENEGAKRRDGASNSKPDTSAGED